MLCGTCNGKGRINRGRWDDTGKMECPDCSGTGYEEIVDERAITEINHLRALIDWTSLSYVDPLDLFGEARAAYEYFRENPNRAGEGFNPGGAE